MSTPSNTVTSKNESFFKATTETKVSIVAVNPEEAPVATATPAPAPAATAPVVQPAAPTSNVAPAPVVQPPAQQPPVTQPVTRPTPPWAWVLGVIGLIAIILFAVMLIKTPLTGGNPAPTPAPIINPVNTGTLSESTKLGFGEFGSYHAVLDSNRNQWTLGWWNENIVRAGTKNLADLKRDGGNLSFTMPYDGWINNSAGELFVDGTKWDLGNYGEDMLEATLIKQGQLVEISYGPGNDSAGFQLWFK